MGISGLLPFLKDISKKCHVKDFRGTTVAIDSYCWLHKGSIACAEQLARGEDTDLYLKYCMKYITLLQSYGIKPVMVFDGQHLPAKTETEAKRRRQRQFARTQGRDLLRIGKYEEARQLFKQCIDITHDMALKLIKECRRLSIDCIVAPYEADAQLAHLSTEGIVDYIITEDSDLLIFGCKKVIFKLGLDGSGYLVEHNRLHLGMKMKPEEYTFEKFRYMCIMSGCDYLNSLAGVGLKRAHKAICMTAEPDIYKLLPRLPRYLNLKNLVVTPEYIENFKLADATIKHQIVYNPITRRLQPLTDPASCGTDEKYLKHAGEVFSADMAFQLAIGNVDPITKKIMDNWNPDELGKSTTASTSIWSCNYKKSLPKNHNNINTQRTTSEQVLSSVTKITEFNNHDRSEFDKKLNEELKMYSPEVAAKRRKVDVETHSEINSDQQPIGSQKQINNPFIKKKRKSISKFAQTSLDKSKCIKSPFFKDSLKPDFSHGTDDDGQTNTGTDISNERSNTSKSIQRLVTSTTVKENSNSEADTLSSCNRFSLHEITRTLEKCNHTETVMKPTNSDEPFITTENLSVEILKELQISHCNNTATTAQTSNAEDNCENGSSNYSNQKSRERPIAVSDLPQEKISPVLHVTRTAGHRTYKLKDTYNSNNNQKSAIKNLVQLGSPPELSNSSEERLSPVLPHVRAVDTFYDTGLPSNNLFIEPEATGSGETTGATNNAIDAITERLISSEDITIYERIDLDSHVPSAMKSITAESVVYVHKGAVVSGIRNKNLTHRRKQQSRPNQSKITSFFNLNPKK